MADVVMLVSAGSALLTGAHRSKYSQYPAGNRRQVQHAAPTTSDTPHVERAAPTASDTLQPKPLTTPVADTPDVNPSSAIMRPFQVAWDGSDEVLDEAQYDPDPPSIPPNYSRYEPVPEKGRPIESNTDQSPTPAEPPTGVVSDHVSQPLPPLPPEPGLKRGLQIPSRISHITSGFKLPPALAKAGVGKKHWKTFTHEVKRHARMSKSQFCTVFASGWAIGVVRDMFMWPIGTVIGGVYCDKKQREKEHENFTVAHTSGALRLMAQRWNKNYFEPLGLQVCLEPPDAVIYDSMEEMDVASTKSFKYQQKKGYSSPAAGEDSGKGDKVHEQRGSRTSQSRTERPNHHHAFCA